MRSRTSLAVALAGWLVACGAAGAGCGDLRQNLSADGSSVDGASIDRAAASDRGTADLAPAEGPSGSADSAVADTGGSGGAGSGDGAAADAGGSGGAAGGDAGGSGGAAGGDAGGSDARADGAADGRDAPAADGGDAREAGGSAQNGTRCVSGTECASGHCVDGYCCNDACPDQCEACDVDRLLGSCAPVVTGAPHGGRAPCSGAGLACGGQCSGTRTACTYPGPSQSCRPQSCNGGMKTQAAGCDGFGACAPVATVTCPQGCAGNDCLGACTRDTECMMADPQRPFCDATGTCTPRKPDGRTCAAGTECTSGQCADGYCCESACTGQCRSCKEPGAMDMCILVVGAPRTGGTPGRSACAGTGACAGACDGVSSDCRMPTSSTTCGSASCTGGSLTPLGGCDGAGRCAQMAGPCATGYCSSPTACGNCPDDISCGAGEWCDAGTCRTKRGNGEPCSADPQCLNGNCEMNAAGTGGVCCATACAGATPRCNAAGSACICTDASCPIGRVCDQSVGACCTPDPCYFGSSCRMGECVPRCGLPTLPRNCGCTSTGCCGDTCCVSGFCSGDSCGSPPQTCPP